MTGQKFHLQLLQGRTGGVAEPVRVEDEQVENENQDDGRGPEKEMGETDGGDGGKDIELCDGHGDSGGGRGGDGHSYIVLIFESPFSKYSNLIR